MACTDSIVTLGYCPDDGASTSGLTLIQAPGISLRGNADIANENYTTGAAMVLAKKALAITKVKNDFIGALQVNKVVTQIAQPVYDTSDFDTVVNKGIYAGDRGVILHRSARRGRLNTLFLNSIELYPLASGNSTIKLIYELNGSVHQSEWNVTLVANQVNSFGKDELTGFPWALPEYADKVKVLVDQTTIAFASAPITCMSGCNNTVPNGCGWAEGWDGTAKIKAEGYGVNVRFQCKCDYEKIFCDLAPTFSGELIWLKWQIMVFEEQYMTNRFNAWVTYNREDLVKNVIPKLENDYAVKWNQLMEGLHSLLSKYRDECLDCRKARWVTNL